MCLCRPSVCASVCPSMMLFLQCLWYASMDFHQTFIRIAFWDRDELFRFWDQKSKVKVIQHDHLDYLNNTNSNV